MSIFDISKADEQKDIWDSDFLVLNGGGKTLPYF